MLSKIKMFQQFMLVACFLLISIPSQAQFLFSPGAENSSEAVPEPQVEPEPEPQAQAEPQVEYNDYGFGLPQEPEVAGSGVDPDANLVEEMNVETTTAPSRWSYNSSMTFATSSRNEPSASQTSDSYIFSGSASYGFSDTIDMSIRGSAINSTVRTLSYEGGATVCNTSTGLSRDELLEQGVTIAQLCEDSGGNVGFLEQAASSNRNIDRSAYFSDAWLGINYNFKNEDEYPGIFFSGDLALIERARFLDAEGSESFENYYGKSWGVSMGFFRTIDPVVLSLNLGYSFNFERKQLDRMIEPGNSFSIQPSLNFAVNNEVSINWGISIGRYGKSRVDGELQGVVESVVQQQMGLRYTLSDSMSLSASSSSNISGEPSASFTIGLGFRP